MTCMQVYHGKWDIYVLLDVQCAYVFTEVGKNINQDKILNLKRYVEDYHKYVESLNFPPKQSDSKDQQQNHEVKKRRGNSS